MNTLPPEQLKDIQALHDANEKEDKGLDLNTMTSAREKAKAAIDALALRLDADADKQDPAIVPGLKLKNKAEIQALRAQLQEIHTKLDQRLVILFKQRQEAKQTAFDTALREAKDYPSLLKILKEANTGDVEGGLEKKLNGYFQAMRKLGEEKEAYDTLRAAYGKGGSQIFGVSIDDQIDERSLKEAARLDVSVERYAYLDEMTIGKKIVEKVMQNGRYQDVVRYTPGYAREGYAYFLDTLLKEAAASLGKDSDTYKKYALHLYTILHDENSSLRKEIQANTKKYTEAPSQGLIDNEFKLIQKVPTFKEFVAQNPQPVAVPAGPGVVPPPQPAEGGAASPLEAGARVRTAYTQKMELYVANWDTIVGKGAKDSKGYTKEQWQADINESKAGVVPKYSDAAYTANWAKFLDEQLKKVPVDPRIQALADDAKKMAGSALDTARGWFGRAQAFVKDATGIGGGVRTAPTAGAGAAPSSGEVVSRTVSDDRRAEISKKYLDAAKMKELASVLTKHGIDFKESSSKVVAAIKKMQGVLKVTPDGIIGNKTYEAMKKFVVAPEGETPPPVAAAGKPPEAGEKAKDAPAETPEVKAFREFSQLMNRDRDSWIQMIGAERYGKVHNSSVETLNSLLEAYGKGQIEKAVVTTLVLSAQPVKDRAGLYTMTLGAEYFTCLKILGAKNNTWYMQKGPDGAWKRFDTLPPEEKKPEVVKLAEKNGETPSGETEFKSTVPDALKGRYDALSPNMQDRYRTYLRDSADAIGRVTKGELVVGNKSVNHPAVAFMDGGKVRWTEGYARNIDEAKKHTAIPDLNEWYMKKIEGGG